MLLSDCSEGEELIVEGTSLEPAISRRMQALGLTCGTKIKVLHKKRAGTAVLLLRGTRFAVGRDICSKITVRKDT